MWYGHDGWGWVWMSIMMAVVWVPLLLILVWAVRLSAGPRQSSELPAGQPEPDALEIARRTYARGEIDRERYFAIVEDLNRAPS